MRDLACCSLRMMKGLPYSSKTMDMVAALWGRRSGLRLSGNSATACSEDFSTRKRCRRVRLLACQRSVAALTIERSCYGTASRFEDDLCLLVSYR